MSTTARRWVLAGLGMLAALGLAGIAWRLRPTGIPQSPAVILPLRCRLAGHGWKKSVAGQLPARHTCRRCESLDLPNP